MYIEIDGNTRKIKMTQEQRLFGVVQDCSAERKYFKMPRIVGDNIDITNCIIYIVYQKSDEAGNIYYGEPNMYMCEDVVLDETEQNVTFSWELTKDIFDISGYLGFKILVKCTDDDGNVKNVWNTIPEFGIICKSMYGDTIHIQEQDKDIVGKLLQDLKQIKNEMDKKITSPSTAEVGQTIVVKSVDENGRPTEWEVTDMVSGDTWDVHYKTNIPEALESGFEITDVDGVPLRLKEMYAMVKIQNGSSTSAWAGCTITTDTGVSIFGTVYSSGGVNLSSGEYAYFVYHVKILPGSDRYFGQCTSSSSTAFVKNDPWLNNWLDYNKVNYFTGIKCTNNLGAGTSQGYGTEIEIWGKTK